MDLLEASAGLKKLVTRHHTVLARDQALPLFSILLDEVGNIVPHEDAIKVSSTRTITSGGLEAFNPQPGEGFYARLSRVNENVTRDVGSTTIWSVTGPDWDSTVTIIVPFGTAAWTVTPQIKQASVDGVKFLAQFA